MNEKPTSPSLQSPPASLELEAAMLRDRHRLRRSRKKLSDEQFQQQLQSSIELRQRREAATPHLDYPDDLPISQHREALVEAIRQRQVIVVCGETGSGKSTQLPKLCLEAGLGRKAMIGHTQPRRLAARSIASRLAEELQTPLGQLVGYQVRFGDQTSETTLIKLMTDGILLAETQSDRFLDAYDAIIIDEAHERSLNIDFLLGFLRRLQAKRPDLKIIITSATIDAERFAEHFSDESGPAPVIQVEGRGYPVETRYLPWEEVSEHAEDPNRRYDLSRHVIAGIQAANRSGQGDVLVFLPTERDIREVSHRVAGHYKRLGLLDRVDLLPLYARLPQSEQQRIFHPDGKRQRIIFATNVAESSLTVPGIRCVVDSGTARISRYSPRSKLQRLPIEPVSRASADQRAGRCGRIGPGVCVRLYSRDDYDSRDAFTTPEIRRTNLASVVLQTKTLRLGALAEFPLLDPPRPEAIREGVQTLVELGALNEQQELTDVGWQLGRLPVDPRVGRIILAAHTHGVLPEVLPIAAALEIQDPRDRPPDKQQAADEAHARFLDSQSDFLAYLRLWRFYQQAREDHTRRQLTRVLRRHFLSPTRMREWSDVYRQLREMAATSLGKPHKSHPASSSKRLKIGTARYQDEPDTEEIVDRDRYAAIHQSLLSGLLSGVAHLTDKNEYTGARGLKLFLWPGSGVFSSKPKWVVAAELVETSKQFARTVARVDPRWIETIGAHVLKRSHHDPHWSRKASGAFCYENQTLFGLPVVVRRRVPLPPIDPATARELLIEQGLAEDQLRTNAKFVRYNRQLQEAIAELAARTRRRELVIDPWQVARFYHERLPQEITDRPRLEKLDRELTPPDWAKTAPTPESISAWLQRTDSSDHHDSLYMQPDDLITVADESIDATAYPDEIEIGASRLPLEYHFEPGSPRDGVRVKVHQAALSQVSDERLGWLVPGLLHDKLLGMIKSLPKRIRRNLVPAADVAAKIENELRDDFGKVPFMTAVCQAMSRHAEMPIHPDDFQVGKLDDHYEFLVTVVDDQGEAIAESRKVESLKQDIGRPAGGGGSETREPAHDESWALKHAVNFDVDRLPREVVRERGGVQVAQYPGLIDHGDSVSTGLFADPATADAAMRRGLTRLYALAERKELRSQIRWLPALDQARINLSGAVSAAETESALIDLLARVAFVEDRQLIRSREEFQKRLADKSRRIAEATQQIATWLAEFSKRYFEVRSALESLDRSGRFESLTRDIQQQQQWLLFDGFLGRVPWNWLQHYPRYFAAIAYRLDKARGAMPRDQQMMATVDGLWDRWLETLPEDQRDPESQVENEVRWMIEELRVSLFAQPLGTAVKVSPQRCEKLIK